MFASLKNSGASKFEFPSFFSEATAAPLPGGVASKTTQPTFLTNTSAHECASLER